LSGWFFDKKSLKIIVKTQFKPLNQDFGGKQGFPLKGFKVILIISNIFLDLNQ